MKKEYLFIIIICVFFGCKKNADSESTIKKENLIGNWINLSFNKDTLYWRDSIIYRHDTLHTFIKHRYKYNIDKNLITLKYSGDEFIDVSEVELKISVNEDSTIVTIDKFEDYFPHYPGNDFKILTKK